MVGIFLYIEFFTDFLTTFRVETKMFVFAYSRKLIACIYENDEMFRKNAQMLTFLPEILTAFAVFAKGFQP
jgi:hypothetical protein